MTTYTCFRCNYTTSYKNSMSSHLHKKKKCFRQIEQLKDFSDEEIINFSMTKNCTLEKICPNFSTINEQNNVDEEISSNDIFGESLKNSILNTNTLNTNTLNTNTLNTNALNTNALNTNALNTLNTNTLNTLNTNTLNLLPRSVGSNFSTSNSFSTTSTTITTQNTPSGIVNTKNFNIDINANCSLEESLSLLDKQLSNCGMTDNIQRKQVIDAIEKSLSSLNDKLVQSNKGIFNPPNIKNHYVNSTINVGDNKSSIQSNNYTKNDNISKGY